MEASAESAAQATRSLAKQGGYQVMAKYRNAGSSGNKSGSCRRCITQTLRPLRLQCCQKLFQGGFLMQWLLHLMSSVV